MLYPTAIAVMMLWSSSANAESDPKSENCTLKQYASVDLTVTNRVLLPVRVGSQSGLMILDPASAFSVVWKNTVDDLALPRRPLPTSTPVRFGTVQITEFATVDSMHLGTANLGKREFLVAPAPGGDAPTASGNTLGTLGADMLSGMDFELDLARRKLNLFSPEHCKGKAVYWSNVVASTPLYRGKLGNLYFPMELDGKSVEATMSPSDSTTSIYTDATKRLYGFDEYSPDVEVEKYTGAGAPRAHFRPMQLTAPGLEIKNFKIRLIPATKNCRLEFHNKRKGGGLGYDESCLGKYPLRLGRDVLEKLRLYFATKENVLYFTSADATK